MFPLSELKRPILCYVTDRRSLPPVAGAVAAAPSDSTSALVDNIEAGARAGIDWIQLREKDLSAKDLSALVRAALDRVRAAGAPARLFVNDRLDIALASGAGGVHLSERGLPVSEVCRLRAEFVQRSPGPLDFLVGASCHSLDSALAAAEAGADYIYFGPVFETPSKRQFGPAQGPKRLAEICRRVRIPVFAIGGITLANAPECLAAGAAGLCAIRLFQSSADIPGVVSRLRGLGQPPSSAAS